MSLRHPVRAEYIIIQHSHSLESLPRASAQEMTNRTLAVHERVNSRFLVLPGSLSIFTPITGHIHTSSFNIRIHWSLSLGHHSYAFRPRME